MQLHVGGSWRVISVSDGNGLYRALTDEEGTYMTSQYGYDVFTGDYSHVRG